MGGLGGGLGPETDDNVERNSTTQTALGSMTGAKISICDVVQTDNSH